MKSDNPFIAALIAITIGLGLPNLLLARMRTRRIKKFIDVLPEALDIIVRGVRSGLPVNDTLRIIANEAQEPVKSEFRRVVEQQALGVSVTEALQKMARRVPATETNFFAIVIEIQSKAGGNLSEAVGQSFQDRARSQADAGQDRRDVDGGSGIRRHHRRRAFPGLRRALRIVAQLYEPAVLDQPRTHRHGHRPLLDGDRRRHDEEDDQL